MKDNRVNKLIIVIPTLLLLLLIGCVKTDTSVNSDDYIVFTEHNELCNFSFEYNTQFEVSGPHYVFDFTPPFMYVSLLTPKKEFPFGHNDDSEVVIYVPSAIEITTRNTFRTAEWKKDEVLKDESKHNNYRLLADVPIDVVGTEGKLFEYYVNNEHKCAIYFNYDGLLWSIELISREEENYNKVKADFDHIVETFKILD